MPLDPSKSYHVKISTHSCNLFWANMGLKYLDGSPVINYWDDIQIRVYARGEDDEEDKQVFRALPTFNSRSYIQSEIDGLNGDLGARMEAKFPGYIQENLTEDWGAGMPITEMVKLTEVTYMFRWYNPEYPDHTPFEDLPGAPKDAEGRYPVDINIFVPVDNIMKVDIEAAIKDYVERFLLIKDFDMHWDDVPTDTDLQKWWQDELDLHKKCEEMRARGEKWKIAYVPDFMEQMYGVNAAELKERGVTHGEPIGDFGGEVMLHFKDGHTEIMKLPGDEKDLLGGDNMTVENEGDNDGF